MAETRDFDPRIIGSITTGVLLLEDFGQVHEAMEFVMGRPIWTHEIPSESAEMKRLVLEQVPDMPTQISGSWQETAQALLDRYGAAISIKKGETVRTKDPLQTLSDALKDTANG
ncbi:hypothetical protein KL86PLE_100281 [uncultured Pleomorphomonas sp.]|uniref:DUF7736 domain-containing protein n=1 Tax=uncultured Pleomorphomonas sp. TaxID=442121 RepID=A0A212L231_9HYPH|nr:hypothetical protein [uncultured Pleomorphomonas sp.]SCM71602.1 hypothetical protein KL86PLE_100281 [uncultured Pleomorphomonas sp.]